MEKWICNPLDLEYRYQYRTSLMGGCSLAREAADPTLLLFKDIYYLFASMSGGFWYSDDLADWKFKETPELPIYDYAPDVRSIGGRVVFSASRRGEPCTFYASADPLKETFQPLASPFDFWDPDIFEDDDGRVYFYWGCTNKEPIWGIEIDPKTMLPMGEKQAMFGEDEARHGWERKGENNKLSEPVTEMDRLIRQYVGTKPFIEGAFMTKYRGKYYLQYAAPGTECNVYADGVYVSDKPLGPFTYQSHNPFSSKPGGFITSAGHGSTIQDKYGNWWHASTMRVSVNESFERRVGLFPCDFDEDGVLHCNQHFADYPFVLPEGVSLLYHNHNCELQRVNPTQRGYDILMAETDPAAVNFEFDSYWFAEGGANPLEWMERLGSRMKLWHINDRGARLTGPAMTPILKTDSAELGTGNIPLEALAEQAKRVGVEAVVLESHRNWVDKSPVKSFQVSAKFLNKHF